jgi:hypothetical protein
LVWSWFGLVWSWFGLVWFGLVWFGLCCVVLSCLVFLVVFCFCFCFCFCFLFLFFFFFFFVLFCFFFFALLVCFGIYTVTASWKDINFRRKFFEIYAAQRGFDHLIPENWYSLTYRKFTSVKVSTYNNSIWKPMVFTN